jgi:CheY-like chemotaxis protein/two-component sensor histidine kinase
MLSARIESRSDLQRAAEVANRQVRHMARLLDDLLDIARITRGTIGVRRERLDLREAVTSAVEMVMPAIESRRHALEVALPPAPLLVAGDRTRLSQVVVNLLDNAAKYTPDGGRLSVSAVQAGTQALIRVRDTGPGIPAEIRPHLFEAFERGQLSVGGSDGGLGLGLALVRQIVELHGGSVEGVDAQGGGTEFVVRLPTSPGELDLARPDTIEGASPRPGRVLVVDDHADVAQMLAMSLESEGCEVATATSGDAARALAAEWKPGLAFVDLSMPGMDGFELARRLRADPALQGVRIVAVTGYGDDVYRRRALSSGFDEYLVKPADVLSLRRALRG